MPIKLVKDINISQLVGLTVLIVTGVGGYYNLRSNVEAHETKIINLQVEKLDEDLYEKDMEILDRLVDSVDKLANEITKLQIEIAGLGK